MATALAASLWAARFGAATDVPVARLAAALAPAGGALSAADVLAIVQFTVLPLDAAGCAAGAATSPAAVVRQVDFTTWMERFGADGEAAALAKAASLFSRAATGPLVLQPWYHGGAIPSAGAAQAALAGKPAGTFLLRTSAQAGAFAVSYVIAGGETRHTRIQHVAGGYLMDGQTEAVPTLPAIVTRFASVLVAPLLSALAIASQRAAEAALAVVPPPASAAVAPAAAVAAPAAAAAAPVTYDVMLSYQWNHQSVVMRIRDALAAVGFAVWMDLDNMSAAYARAMAGAVKNSDCVVVCASQAYINSANCTNEANLCFEHRNRFKKPILIANMQKDFYPGTCEHVLGVLAAGQLFCDFTSPDDEAAFASGIGSLIKQLQEHGVKPRLAAAAAGGAAAMPSLAASKPAPLVAAPSFTSSDLATAPPVLPAAPAAATAAADLYGTITGMGGLVIGGAVAAPAATAASAASGASLYEMIPPPPGAGDASGGVGAYGSM